jgi:hypothetical protein
MQDDAITSLRAALRRHGIRPVLLLKEEVLEWIEAGLTGEELRGKLRAKVIETDELEMLHGDGPRD